MIGLDGVENQRPPELITEATTVVTKFWSVNYSDLKFLYLSADTDHEFVVLRRVDGTIDLNDLCSVLGVSLIAIEQYLDNLVVQGHDPAGANLIARLYYDVERSGVLHRCMPRAYLYQVASALGSIEPV